MKFTGKNHQQGDVQLHEITEIPMNVKKVEKQYLAKSEKSGSVHAIFGVYDQYETDTGIIIDAKEDCILNHTLESVINKTGADYNNAEVLDKKDHRHCIIPKGIHFVSIQNRFDPLSGLKEKVRD